MQTAPVSQRDNFEEFLEIENDDLPELFGESDADIAAVSLEAIARLQKKGIDVFYFDFAKAHHILEKPTGERFVIRYTEAAFEVLYKLDE